MYDGWPELNGSLGPMGRTVSDVARLLDVIVGYDSEDPLTAAGVGHVPGSYTRFLDKNGLKGTSASYVSRWAATRSHNRRISPR